MALLALFYKNRSTLGLDSFKVAKTEQHLHAGAHLEYFVPINFIYLSVFRSLILQHQSRLRHFAESLRIAPASLSQ
jgi:hypothetical protein